MHGVEFRSAYDVSRRSVSGGLPMRIRPLATAAVLGLAAAPAVGAPDNPGTTDSVKLRYLWQPGTTSYYRTIRTVDARTVEDATGKETTRRGRCARIDRMEVYSVRDDG